MRQQQRSTPAEVDVSSGVVEVTAPNLQVFLVSGQHPVGQRVVAAEALAFPSASDIFAESFGGAQSFVFMGVVNATEDKLLHGARLSVPHANTKKGVPFLLSQLAASGQGVDLDEVREHYCERGIDIADCWSVETNFRVERAKGFRGGPVSYASMFRVLTAYEKPGAFAHVNRHTILSFSVMGMSCSRILDRDDLRAPGPNNTFDQGYLPSYVPTDNGTRLSEAAASIPFDLILEDKVNSTIAGTADVIDLTSSDWAFDRKDAESA